MQPGNPGSSSTHNLTTMTRMTVVVVPPYSVHTVAAGGRNSRDATPRF
jgi:hypothetical protein